MLRIAIRTEVEALLELLAETATTALGKDHLTRLELDAGLVVGLGTAIGRNPHVTRDDTAN